MDMQVAVGPARSVANSETRQPTIALVSGQLPTALTDSDDGHDGE